MAMHEDSLNWDEINKYRKSTKGCMLILKDKINQKFESKKSFDMSFGFEKDEEKENKYDFGPLEKYEEEPIY